MTYFYQTARNKGIHSVLEKSLTDKISSLPNKV